MQSCRSSSGEQVSAVRSDMARKVARVKAQAERVPRGMFLAGLTSSPDMLAPDMMPVTPEKRTPKTVKKLMGTASSSCEQSKANLR